MGLERRNHVCFLGPSSIVALYLDPLAGLYRHRENIQLIQRDDGGWVGYALTLLVVFLAASR